MYYIQFYRSGDVSSGNIDPTKSLDFLRELKKSFSLVSLVSLVTAVSIDY